LGAKKIEIKTAMFAAKIDGNRSFLQKSQSTQHYQYESVNQAINQNLNVA